MTDQPIHALIIDAGPLISSTSTTSLLSRTQKVYTTPSVVAEIRDAATRSRLETIWLPFLQQRTPRAESVRIVSEFAKKTGDYTVLSVTDLQLLALTYELEVEENKGDWRLRRIPGQKGVNGPIPKKKKEQAEKREEERAKTEKNESKGVTNEKPKGEKKKVAKRENEKGGKKERIKRESKVSVGGEKNKEEPAVEKTEAVEKGEEEGGVDMEKAKVEGANMEKKKGVREGLRSQGERKVKGEMKERGREERKDRVDEKRKKLPRRRGRKSTVKEETEEVNTGDEMKEDVKEEGKEVKEELKEVKEVKKELEEVKEEVGKVSKEVIEQAKELEEELKGPNENFKEEVQGEVEKDAVKEEVQGEIEKDAAKEEVQDVTKEFPKVDPCGEKTTSPENIIPITQETISEEPKAYEEPSESSTDDSDNEGWITTENIHSHKAKDAHTPSSSTTTKKLWPMAAALATTDFAMQNVLLQMNLHLVSPNDLQRVHRVSTWVLRCHACFKICRDMNKQFCPSCGGATLMRASCSTDSQGVFQVHLKSNMQWNNRGSVYSIPKTQHGSASGKGVKKNLILREDQMEYQREVRQKERQKERDLLDPDYLPGILTGERRDMIGARPRIGYGRVNPNEGKAGRSRR